MKITRAMSIVLSCILAISSIHIESIKTYASEINSEYANNDSDASALFQEVSEGGTNADGDDFYFEDDTSDHDNEDTSEEEQIEDQTGEDSEYGPSDNTVTEIEDVLISNVESEELELETAGGTIIDSGTCGTNVTWTLEQSSSDYTLRISGSGWMKNYNSDSVPWHKYKSKIVFVSIDQGVMSIGASAFSGCVNLTSISIPGSVTSIGDWAFYDCESLTSISIPGSVTSIGDGAFAACNHLASISIPGSVTSIGNFVFGGCHSFTSINIPGSVTSIGNGAFDSCKSLTSISIPSSVTNIGINPFESCSQLNSITVDENNPSYDSRMNSNAIIDSKTNLLVSGCMNTKIPNSVTSIGDSAFSGCNHLTSISIPGSVTSIGIEAFYFCYSLTSISIPSSVTNIGAYAFEYISETAEVFYDGSEEEFNDIFIEEGNESLLNATIHYNAYNPSGICFMIDASAGEHGSINPSGIVSVDKGENKTFIFTPDPGYIVSSCIVDGVVHFGDIREYSFENVTSNHTIQVSFYDKEKLEYKGDEDTFTFSLSNPDSIVEETEYHLNADLGAFFTPSTTVQNDLIKMSMRVAMAAMDPDDYTRTPKRASYIKDLMTKLDFQFRESDNPLESDIVYEDPDGDTIGTAIGRRQIEKDNEEYTLVMIAVRGGGYLSEWAGNANVGDGISGTTTGHHNGFNIASDEVINRLKRHLEDLDDKSHVKVWICGYSRAAAVSNLTAMKLDDGAIEGISSENVYAFCFECPQNSTVPHWWSKERLEKYKNIVNIVNIVDLVPLVTPNNGYGWVYGRFGTTYYIDDGNFRSNSFHENYGKMRATYKYILGNKGSEERLRKNLRCYEELFPKNKFINYANKRLLDDLIKGIPSDYTFVEEYQNTIYDIVKTRFRPGGLNLWDWITMIAREVSLIANSRLFLGSRDLVEDTIVKDYIMINHYPELTLAWIDSLELSDYIVDSELDNIEIIMINCPVDVTVRDGNNNVVGQIINNEPVNIEDGIATFIDSDGQQVVIIPSDGIYTIRATAYDNGDVSITSASYSGESISPNKIISFQQIEICKDETVTAVISGDSTTVSDTEGNILSPDIEQSDGDIVSLKVDSEAEGPGSVEGGGFYYAGEFCQVSAVPEEDRAFVGWYIDDQLVSTESTYRFPVLNDTTIKGVFSDFPEGSFSVMFDDTSADPYDGLYYNPATEHYETVYKGYALKPTVTVIGGSGALIEGVDYTVKYSNNTNYNAKGKPATITVTGKGNFTGKKILDFYIQQADLGILKERRLITVPDEIKIQSGKKASPIITYGDYQLKASDMSISNQATVKEDTTVDISGKGNFTGKLENISVRVTAAADARNYTIKVALKPKTHIYNGKEQTLTCSTPEVPGELTVTAGTSRTPLMEGTDYHVTYISKSNIAAGTATIKVEADGDYLGEITKTFKIQPDKTSAMTAELTYPDEDILYDRAGAKPDVTVTVTKADSSKEVLSPGKDYKIIYSNNKNVGTGKYAVSFIGNYAGHASISNKLFSIKAAPFEGAKAKSADLIYTKPGKYLSAPMVSIDKVQLSAKDYSVRYFDGDTELTSKSRLTLDSDTTAKEITVKVTGKGNYQSQEITTTYSVHKADSTVVNLTKVKIVAKEKNSKGKDVAVGKQEYTGKSIRPEIRVLIKQGKVWTEVPRNVYSVNYINNVNRGKATIIITGDGTNSVGSKKVNFTIGTKNLGFFSWLFGNGA